MIATMCDSENVRGPQQFGEIYPWLEQKKPAIRGGPKSGRKCRETAIAMYGDSRFQPVPYRTHVTSILKSGLERSSAPCKRKTPAWDEPAGVHGIGCRVRVSADTGKLTLYRVVRPALLFSGRSYLPLSTAGQKRG